MREPDPSDDGDERHDDRVHGDVHVTCADDAEAERIADLLVDRSLAACVQLHPVRSVFRWGGAIERDAEVMLVAKTRRDRFAEVVDAIERAHSYDLPAITFVATTPSPRTATWIDDALTTAPTGGPSTPA